MNKDQNIPKLPAEIIVHISKYLNIQDKFKLRLINKEFKTTFDYLINLDQLIIDDSESKIHENWFYTNRRKNEIDLIEFNFEHICDFDNILNDLFKKHLFLNLKKLSFYFHLMSINFKETINQLKYLEELNIKCAIRSNSILSLSKLKILSIQQLDSKCTIELETPLLSILKCDNLEYYQFNYPEKIIYFDTKKMINLKKFVNYQIQQFKNLEYFISHYEIFEELKPISVTKLNHLKELHLNNQNYIGIEELIKIKEIYELKLRLKLNNLRIFISGIDYENLKELNEHQFINQLDLIFSNYSKTIDIIPFIHKIDFNKLFKFLNSNPNVSLDNVIKKFPNIQRIDANQVNNDNVDCFFQFLSKYDYLETLHLKLLIDNQIIYLNKLPDLCKRIKYLHLNNLNVNESPDLDFLFKFKKLSFLELGELDDMNILENLSINLNTSITCKFIYKQHSFYIQCDQNTEYWYNFEKFDSSSKLFERFDDLIDHYSDSSDSDDYIVSDDSSD